MVTISKNVHSKRRNGKKRLEAAGKEVSTEKGLSKREKKKKKGMASCAVLTLFYQQLAGLICLVDATVLFLMHLLITKPTFSLSYVYSF